jgi:hypothetical protein
LEALHLFAAGSEIYLFGNALSDLVVLAYRGDLRFKFSVLKNHLCELGVNDVVLQHFIQELIDAILNLRHS